MTISTTYEALKTIALNEFGDVVVSAQIMPLPTGDPLKLRFDIADGSLLDVFISVSGRYSYLPQPPTRVPPSLPTAQPSVRLRR